MSQSLVYLFFSLAKWIAPKISLKKLISFLLIFYMQYLELLKSGGKSLAKVTLFYQFNKSYLLVIFRLPYQYIVTVKTIERNNVPMHFVDQITPLHYN